MNEKYDDTVLKKREFYLLKLKYFCISVSNWHNFQAISFELLQKMKLF